MTPFNNKSKIFMSIIIPVFNRQGVLWGLLNDLEKAIVKYNIKDQVEIIIIDDFSDKPIMLPSNLAQTILYRNKVNLGAPKSRKIGFQMSKGSFIHFHDSDDTVTDTWLIDVIEQLKERSEIDLLLTGRIECWEENKKPYCSSFFDRHVNQPCQILARLYYWNCIGPLGGVTFSRRIVKNISFDNLASCQDWLMYIEAFESIKTLCCRCDIQFISNKYGSDRISDDPRKKILGHLQLSKRTAMHSPFKRKVRLFYLYAKKQYIVSQKGLILTFFNKHRFRILIIFLVIGAYSFLSKKCKS